MTEASNTYAHSSSADLTIAAAFASSGSYYNVFVTITGGGDVEIYDGTTTHFATGPGSTIVYIPMTASAITITAVNGIDVFEYFDIDSGNVIYVSSVKRPISADMTIHANFIDGALFNYYVVDATIVSNGILEIDDGTNVHTVNVPSAVVNILQSVSSLSFEALPGTGYKFEKYVIDAAESLLNPADSSISGDMDVTVVFNSFPPVPPMIKDHYITTITDAGSIISPSGIVAVVHGADQTFYFTAADGYYVSAVTVDGVDLSPAEIALGQYTFSNVSAIHTIEVKSEMGGVILEIQIVEGSGYAEYSLNGSPFIRYTQPVHVSEHSDLTVRAYPDAGYRFAEWKVGAQEFFDSSISFDDITDPLHIDLLFKNEGGSSGSAGDNGDLLWWAAGAAILLLAAGTLIWFLFFWRRMYEVVKVQSSAAILGKDKARRKKAYAFAIEGGPSGTVSYSIGEDGIPKTVIPNANGEYVIPKEDVIDKLTIEHR